MTLFLDKKHVVDDNTCLTSSRPLRTKIPRLGYRRKVPASQTAQRPSLHRLPRQALPRGAETPEKSLRPMSDRPGLRPGGLSIPGVNDRAFRPEVVKVNHSAHF